jgi:hypothetical protein
VASSQPYQPSATNNRFACGARAQVGFSALAARKVFERIDDSNGNSDLLGATWSFQYVRA